MAEIVGRKPIELKLSDQLNGYIPVFDSSSRLWTTIDKEDLISGSAFTSGSNAFTGDQIISGSVIITGSLEVNGRNYINDSSSFESRIITNSSSFANFSGSYINESSSFADRIRVNSSSFADFSGSYVNESSSFADRIRVNSSSFADFSGSYINESASFASRITNNSSSTSLLSGSYLASSASFSNQITTNSSSFALFSGSYINDSASFDFRINNVSSSLGSLSSSLDLFSGSFNTGSFTGSFTGSLIGTASYATQALTASNANTASSADDFIVRGTLTAQTINVQTITSSVDFVTGSSINGSLLTNTHQFTGSVDITGSLTVNGSNYITTSGSTSTRLTNLEVFSGSYSTGSFTGSFIGRVTGSFSGSLSNLQNTVLGHIPFFSSSQVLADSVVRQLDNGSGSFSIAINQDNITTAAPEALYVSQPSATSYNVISGKGNLNNYLQLNIQNTNTGENASSDVVATANNGNETTNYINMGINSEGFTGSIGDENDAYLYSTGRHLHIGTATNFPIQFFAGGEDHDANRKFQLNPNNLHELTGSLSITNKLNVIGGVTASLQGTASWANNAITASHALQASSASFASTASSVNRLNQNVVISGSLTVTGSTNIIGSSGTTLFSSNADTLVFTGSIYASGSLEVNGRNYINDSSSLASRITTDSSSFTAFSGSYINESSSFASRITNNSASISSLSASFTAFSGSFMTGSFTGSFTGSLFGTSSYAIDALSSSFATTASYVLQAVSASYAATASSANDFLVRGTLIAQTIIAQTITSSIDFVTGSTRFGSTTDNTHQFTGSVSISGSLAVNNSPVILTNQTSSMSVLTASYALHTGKEAIVTSPGGIYYIDGVAKPVLTFTPGKTYRFNTSNVDSPHPFKFSLSPNGPTQYTYGVTSGSGYIEINVDYNTSSSLYYYCTIHSGMGNAVNTLRDENLIHNSQTSSMSVASASYAATASFVAGISDGTASFANTASYAVNADLLDGKDSTIFATTGSNIFVGSQTISGSILAKYNSYEIHVNGVDGDDTTGDGTLLNPVASITKALTLITAPRLTIIVHPGTYTESPTITTTNTTIFATGLNGGNTLINGTLTINAAARISGMKMTNLVVNTSESVYMASCVVDTSLTKSGSGFTEFTLGEYQCSSGINISGAGIVTFVGVKLYFVNVNNSAASVILKGCTQILSPIVTSGSLAIADSIVVASTATGSAITTYPNSVLTLANSQVLVPAGDNVARVSLSGFYSILNAVYDKNNSTLASLSATGGSTSAISFFQDINLQSTTITGSLNITGSTIQIGNNTLLGNTTLSGSIIITGSVNAQSDINLAGLLRLDPATDPGATNLTASFLFTSASNTATGYDLYLRQNGNLVKFKWLEGMLNTGILYGGVLTYSASNFYISSGSGIIVNHNATTGSEISPTITYVNWAASTHSIANPSDQNTYVFIDANGDLQQQNVFFTPEQYHDALPIGRISHYGATGSLVTGVGNNILTTYDLPQQLGQFTRAFGPLKISGFTITPQVGNLSLNIGSGTAFNLGGYYQDAPDLPSTYNSNTYLTSSIIRLYRSGSGFQFDNNGGSYYTSVNPLVYDDGTGTLATVGNGNWSIQRVFVNPITGRSHVYYGQSTYPNYLNAVQSVATDDFVESEVTKNAYVFAGYLVMQGGASNDDLSVGNTTNAIIQAGLFRNSVGGSGGATTAVSDLNDLSDVNISSPSNGQALIYSTGTWINGNPISSSYAATASYVENAQTASYVQIAQTASYVENAQTASYVLNAISASYAATASSADNFIVRGTLTAQTINVQTITSSIEFNTGSTRNGSTTANTHEFTGSVSVSGSLAVNGSNTILTNQTSSMSVATASYVETAQTASYVLNAQSASYWSGSIINAETASYILQAVSASYANNADLALTSSYAYNATSASYALTASYISGSAGVGFPFSGSAIITGSFLVSQSFVDFTQATYVTGSFTGSFSGTASNAVSSSFATSALTASSTPNAIVTASVNISTITFTKGDNSTFNITVAQSGSVESSSFAINAISASHALNANTASFAFNAISSSFASNSNTASFALNANTSSFAQTASYASYAVFAGNSPGSTSTMTQSVAATTWSFTHNLNTRNPLLQVYDSTNSQIIPLEIIGSDPNQATIYFDAPESGFAVASNGGLLTVNGSTSRLDQTTSAVTWSFQHNLATRYPNFIIYDSTDNVVIPAGIHAISDMEAEIYFAFPSTGVAIANFSGISGSINIATSSFATTASFASFALNATSASHAVTASYLLGQSPTSSYALTASYVELSLAAVSSSYALTSSYAVNSTTASYGNNFIVGNTLTIDQTLTDYHTVPSSIVGSNNMFNLATGSYSSAFFKYTVANGANARTGEVMAVWNNGSIQYTDNSTVDIGDTSGVVAEAAIAANSIQFNITTATSGWKLKSLGTFM